MRNQDGYDPRGGYAQQPYDEVDDADAQAYDEDDDGEYDGEYDQPKRYAPPPLQIISTNPVINLTCLLAAASGLMGLFFFFADTRSRAVRRYAVQSVGLLSAFVFASAGLGVVGLIVGWMPVIGVVLSTLLWLAWAGMLIGALALRILLMLHGYRGEGYTLPVFGRRFRQFE